VFHLPYETSRTAVPIDPEAMTPAQAARYLAMSTQAFTRHFLNGTGPAFDSPKSRTRRYRLTVLQAWIKAHPFKPAGAAPVAPSAPVALCGG
jgi:hypothetical protein